MHINKLILNEGVNHAHLGPFWYQTFPTPQTSFLVGTFFAASYSKMALGGRVKNRRISSNATYIWTFSNRQILYFLIVAAVTSSPFFIQGWKLFKGGS